MDPTDMGFIKGAVVFALLSGTGLTAYWLRLRAKMLSRTDQPALDRIHEELVQSHAGLEARLLEVEERLDFAERRLLQETVRKVSRDVPEALTPV